MLAAVEEAEPLEADVDVALEQLGGVDLLHALRRQFPNPVLHRQTHRLLLQLHLLLRVYPGPVLLLQHPVPSFPPLHPRL